MYIAYGWPKVITTEAHNVDAKAPCIYVEAIGTLLFVAKTNCVQVWQRGFARLKLGEYRSSDKDLLEDGEFRAVAWNAPKKSLVVLTTKGCIYILGLNATKNPLLPDGIIEDTGTRMQSIHIFVRVAFATSKLVPSSLVVDDKTILLGCAEGELAAYTWNGFQKGCLPLLPPPKEKASNPFQNPECVVKLQYCTSMNTIVILLKNGMCALYFLSEGGLRIKASSSSFCWILAKNEFITDAQMSEPARILALGTKQGLIHLFNIHTDLSYAKKGSFSLHEWGHTVESTGPVSCLQWTKDAQALAVVWRDAGLGVWSPYGCKLMSHMLKRASANHESSSMNGTAQACKRLLSWSPEGMQLFANSNLELSDILVYSFAHACIQSEPVKRSLNPMSLLTAPAAFLLGDDRLLCIYGANVTGDTSKPVLQHLMLPQTYILANWPAKHLALSRNGIDIAISGSRGLVLYNMKQKRWRMFGDVNQELELQCHKLMWMDKMIVMCALVCKNRASHFDDCDQVDVHKALELRVYPRYHLDSSSLLATYKVSTVPFAMNSKGEHLIVLSGTSGKLEVTVLQLVVDGKLDPSSRPTAKFIPIKELCIVTFRQVPVTVSFLPEETLGRSQSAGPKSCIVLHMNGQLCILDLDSGSEKEVLDKVEHFWIDIDEEDPHKSLSLRAIDESTSSAVDDFDATGVLWTYGARGISILYTGKILRLYNENKSLKQELTDTDPELEYDKEVYPLALFPDLNSIIGISQHIAVIPKKNLHGFHPIPKSHPVLSPLVRYLLHQGARSEASMLIGKAINHPHFSHSLEWLVFTVLESEYSKPKQKVLNDLECKSSYDLESVLNLIRAFPIFVDIIVRVARKIDPIHWNLLFSKAGQPATLFQTAMENESFQTAAGFLVIVETIEGPGQSQECAFELLQETLNVRQYDLTGELVRFLVRSAKDMIANSPRWKEEDKSFLGYLINFGSPMSSSSAREDLLKAAVQRLLSTHAAALIAGRKLQDLSAFVQKSGFDIVPLLKEERYGVAKLSGFKEALNEIEKALGLDQSNRIISQADCELLLEAFRDAGITEWVVVLATILHRAPLLLNLFRDDNALWSVYIKNLENDTKYSKLLEEVERGMNEYRLSG